MQINISSAHYHHCPMTRLSEALAWRDVITTSVVPVALIHPASPAAILGQALDGIEVAAVAAAMSWVGVTTRMIQDEMRVGLGISEAVAVLLEATAMRIPSISRAIFARFLVPRRRVRSAYGTAGYHSGLVFGCDLQDAMARMEREAMRLTGADALPHGYHVLAD